MSAVAATTTTRKRTLSEVLASLRQPKVAVMLALGFSSGLPFFLSGNTLGYWLRDEGTTLAAIGFLSWVGLAYSLKFLWAPLIDALGTYRLWILGTLIALGVTIAALGSVPPGSPAFWAILIALVFASATRSFTASAGGFDERPSSGAVMPMTATLRPPPSTVPSLAARARSPVSAETRSSQHRARPARRRC